MNIDIHMFHTGKDNAVTREQLSSMTGMSDRKVREQISELISKGYVILSSSGSSGYWLPDSYKEVEDYIAEQEKRGKECIARAKSAKKLLKQRDQYGLGFVCQSI